MLDDEEIRLVIGRSDQQPVRADKAVHLAAHSNFVGEIDAWLDRETDSQDQLAVFARLEIVDVRPRSVQFARIDRMSRAMNEVFTVPPSPDDFTGGVVNLSTPHNFVP